MIARKFRFHGYGSLNFVYKHGKTVRSPQLAIKYIINDRRTSPRFSVVVSKKVHKSAVTRNRIRRRVYEIIRQHQPAITKPYDVVITVFQADVLELAPGDLMKSLTSLLRQAEII